MFVIVAAVDVVVTAVANAVAVGGGVVVGDGVVAAGAEVVVIVVVGYVLCVARCCFLVDCSLLLVGVLSAVCRLFVDVWCWLCCALLVLWWLLLDSCCLLFAACVSFAVRGLLLVVFAWCVCVLFGVCCVLFVGC